MSGSFVGNGERMNFDSVPQFPTSDPIVWNIDEDAVLDELYGMLTADENKPFNDQLNHLPQMQDSVSNMNSYLPNTNKLQHFDGYKPQFPLTSNHAVSLPMLPTQEQPMKFNQMPDRNAHQDMPMQQQAQPSLYPPVPRYTQNNSCHNPAPNSNIPSPLNIPMLDKAPPYAPTLESTLVTFVDLKSFYEKGQCRLQGKSEQRLDYASSFVRIYLENPDNVKAKSAFVERSPDAAHILKDNVGQVPLKILPDENNNWIKVNLDDAGSEVYKLSKVKGEERNLFRIGLKLLFKDTNTSKTFYSDSFQVKSKPKSTDGLCEDGEKPVMVKVEPELKKRPVKRSRTDEQELMLSSPGSIGSSVFPEVITDHLEAATANIKHLKVNHPIQTQRGDVAYHFKLKDLPKNIKLEEGDIVGFFEDSNGKSEIKRLTCDNVRHTKLAGVISRSAWLEGKTPSDKEKDPTDVVCVIGVVSVKVRGPVKNGERLYASLSSFPGVAMPESVIKQVTSQDLTLVGQSLETVKDSSPDSVHLVSSFVSILLSIQTQHTNKALKDMRDDVMNNVDSKIAMVKRTLLRGLKWKLVGLLVFLILLAVLFYQLYAPFTAYRYWKCAQGSIDGSTSEFTFTTVNYQVPRVKGIEFHFDDLMDKLDENYKPQSNDSSYRYYLNLDRCAGGNVGNVRGPVFYTMNRECNKAYYYHNGSYEAYKTGKNYLCSFESTNCGDCGTEERALVTSKTDFVPSTPPPGNMSLIEEECLSGICNKGGSATFRYFPFSLNALRTATGVEVTIKELQNKFKNDTISKGKPADSDRRYFFNLRRCVNNNDVQHGPRFFAVNGECNKAYYYSQKSKTWVQYKSAKNVECSSTFLKHT